MGSRGMGLAICAIAGLAAGSAFGQATPTAHPTAQAPAAASDDKTPPGTGAADLPHNGPIVGGRDLQPRPSGPPSKQETQQINQLLQQTPPDPAVNGPVVQPHDLFGNPLGGSPTLDQKKP